MPTSIPIEVKRGDTRRHAFRIKDTADTVIDISGWTGFLLTIDPSNKPADNSANIEQMTGTLVTDGTDGRVYFVPAGTAPVGKYSYDCQALDDNGEKVTFAEGKYVVEQDITKD